MSGRGDDDDVRGNRLSPAAAPTPGDADPALSLLIGRPDGPSDPRWLALRLRLWPDASAAEHRRDMVMVLERNCCVLLAVTATGEVAGFAEASLRVDYVNGTRASPVGFLEGLYVEPDWRRRGVARLLVDAVQRWVAAQGCSELASDSLLENVDAHAAHRAMGFEETERVVYFVRPVRRD